MLLLAERAGEAPQLLSIACSACHRATFWTRLLCRPAQRCPALRTAPLTSGPGPGPGGCGARTAYSSGCRGGFARPPRGPQHPSSLRVPPPGPPAPGWGARPHVARSGRGRAPARAPAPNFSRGRAAAASPRPRSLPGGRPVLNERPRRRRPMGAGRRLIFMRRRANERARRLF